MSAQNAFVATNRFKTAIALLNETDAATLEKVSSTIISRLGDPALVAQNGGSLFSTQEREQLQTVFAPSSPDDLDIILTSISYILDQSAFSNLSADKLTAHLAEHALCEASTLAIAAVWRAQGPALIARLRDRVLGAPLVLADVDWRMQLTMAHGDLTKTKVLSAVLDLTLQDPSAAASAADAAASAAADAETGAGEGARGGLVAETGTQHVRLELDKDAMLKLFKELERVQSQLDQITK